MEVLNSEPSRTRVAREPDLQVLCGSGIVLAPFAVMLFSLRSLRFRIFPSYSAEILLAREAHAKSSCARLNSPEMTSVLLSPLRSRHILAASVTVSYLTRPRTAAQIARFQDRKAPGHRCRECRSRFA